jgi:hypothetical protein
MVECQGSESTPRHIMLSFPYRQCVNDYTATTLYFPIIPEYRQHPTVYSQIQHFIMSSSRASDTSSVGDTKSTTLSTPRRKSSLKPTRTGDREGETKGDTSTDSTNRVRRVGFGDELTLTYIEPRELSKFGKST